jgi:hypothetical protein
MTNLSLNISKLNFTYEKCVPDKKDDCKKEKKKFVIKGIY